ncbi:MAG: diadenylate cyclase CdaA [Clostridia bacterium]|nr:diadenylate cyclase CdaA [Clostridia bacterium]
MEEIKSIVRTIFLAFSEFSILDAIDILLVTLLLYGLIRFVRETRAVQLVKGIALLFGAYIISDYLELGVLNSLLDYFFQFAFVALLVVFQPEIRRVLEQLGKSNVSKSLVNAVSSGSHEHEAERAQISHAVSEIANAIYALQRLRMGALIVFERNTKLGEIAETGTIVDAAITGQLVGNVFFNKAPLHDGAAIIRGDRLYAAGCILPLTSNDTISADLGTRHRAALGMSENSDAVVVVVSEETAQISIALNGVLTRNYTRDTLIVRLESLLLPQEKDSDKKESAFSVLRRVKHGRNEETH